MRVEFNSDASLVNKIRESIAENDGYCPCKIEHTEESFCMCKEFRDKIADESFEGYCHCKLYYKEK